MCISKTSKRCEALPVLLTPKVGPVVAEDPQSSHDSQESGKESTRQVIAIRHYSREKFLNRDPENVSKDELMFAVMDIGHALGITDSPDTILAELVQDKLLQLFPGFDNFGDS